MSLRPWISKEVFGRRLSDSLGVADAFRTENWLCVARLIVSLYCYSWIHTAPRGTIDQFWPIQSLLGTYLIYSLLILVLLRLHGIADSAFRLTTLSVDLFFGGTITLLTGAAFSPFSVLWIFVIVAAGYRWSLHETSITAMTCGLLLFAEVAVIRLLPRVFQDSIVVHSRIDRMLLLIVFLVVGSWVLGFLAVRERSMRAESTLVAHLLGRAHAASATNQGMESLFGAIDTLYAPRKTLLAVKKGNIEEVFYWESTRSEHPNGVIRTVSQFSKWEATAFSFPAHTWYFDRSLSGTSHEPHFVAFDAFGRRIRWSSPEVLQSSFPATDIQSLIATSLSFGDAWNGRLILASPSLRPVCPKALHFLQSLGNKIGPAVQNIHLLEDIRAQIEDHVRAGFTRELHDGTIQSLLSAEMQIEVLRRQGSNSSSVLEQKLANLQSLIHMEAGNLRDLIEKTKPLNFQPKELPDFLAELVAKFRRETGISVRLETVEENITLPPKVCHEIVRIVQEGLSNVRKHSGARNVVITLCEANNGKHRLLIADDGQGFGFRGLVTQTQLDASHRGPGVIKERVRLIGGELTIDSTPGSGARLEITIPSDSSG